MKNLGWKLMAISAVVLVLVNTKATSSASSSKVRVDSPSTVPMAVLETARDKKEAEEIAAMLGKRMKFFETENFTWCTSLPKGKMTKIMNEAERCYKIFAQEAGYSSWKKFWAGGRKCMGVIVPNKRDYRKYIKWYAKKYPVYSKEQFVKNHVRGNWFSEPATRNVMVTHLKPNDEIFVGAIMCHLMGHQCIDRHRFNNNFTPGWLRESMGLYFQGKVHGRMQCGSFDDPYGLGEEDEARQKGLKNLEFKSRVKKSIGKHRLKNTKNIFQLATLKELTFLDTQKGHLIVSWMLKKRGNLAKFIAATKSAWPGDIVMENTKGKVKAQTKALKSVFGVTPEDADKALRAFAKSGY